MKSIFRFFSNVVLPVAVVAICALPMALFCALGAIIFVAFCCFIDWRTPGVVRDWFEDSTPGSFGYGRRI